MTKPVAINLHPFTYLKNVSFTNKKNSSPMLRDPWNFGFDPTDAECNNQIIVLDTLLIICFWQCA